nr:MAG: replication associated protein [Arizlama virus]
MANFRSRRFTYTSFYTDDCPPFTNEQAELLGITYMLYGLEECPTTHRSHFQGYIEFKHDTSIKKLQEIIHDKSAHCEVARGSIGHNYDYCTKDGYYIEIDTKKVKGQRTDLEALTVMVKSGKRLEDIAEMMPVQCMLYKKHIGGLADIFTKHRDPNKPPIVTWLYGKTGSGKTKYVYDKHKDVYMKGCNKWWDGYQQNECIVIDDYKITVDLDFKELLRITDRYPYSGETKGGSVKINSQYIYITHTLPPSEVFGYADDNGDFIKQLLRRMTVVCTSDGLSVSGGGLKGNTNFKPSDDDDVFVI